VTVNIGLIDYGMGNLHSVKQSFKRLGKSLEIIKRPQDMESCNALILPGVGAFDPAIQNLRKTNLIPHIKKWADEKRPLLGICLGLQLMFESSHEGKLNGLGLLKGNVAYLPKDQGERIPHMGWALLNKQKNCPLIDKNKNSFWMYFVHSYAANPLRNDLAATVNFGEQQITAIVWKERIGACQFHPEKSGKAGQELLSNWLKWLNEGAEEIS